MGLAVFLIKEGKLMDEMSAGFAMAIAALMPQPPVPFEYEPLPPEKPHRERDRSARRKPKARRQR